MNVPLPPWIQAFAWALVHFLWQGALVGLAALILLHLTRRRSPELRYGIGCAGLVTMAACIPVTTLVLTGTTATGSGLLVDITDTGGGFGSWSAGLGSLIQPVLPAILVAWSLGALWMFLRLGRGFLWLNGRCLREAQEVEGAWKDTLARLAADLAVSRPLRLLRSTLVDTPLVLGWLRPRILVPAAAFAGLDAEALELVLVHELAHVRRWDGLVNQIQCLIEGLLFFHPAVWWISRQVRREREHCCDDTAVRACGDSIRFASALAALEALRLPPSMTIRLATTANEGNLMFRIRRILAPSLPATSGSLPLTGALALALLAGGLFSHRLQSQEKPAPRTAPVPAQEIQLSQIKVKHRPKPPAYPEEARNQRIQGIVVVELTVGTDGVPKEVKALSGPPELAPTAVEYAKEWRFEPVTRDGKPVPVRFKLTMPFKLK